MIQDAFGAGVEPGGLHSSREIKLLIGYMLAMVNEPMSRASILTVLCGNGMANFFDTCAAIESLLELHNLQEDEEKRLTVTPVGRHVVATLQDSLPYTLRERSVAAAKKLLSRLLNERENHVTIVNDDHGCTVTCTVGNTETPLLSLTLLVGDEEQAERIRERFLNDPLSVYRDVIDTLTHDPTL